MTRRVFKQTLKSAGGNLTQHVEEVLSALFLSAKRTDGAFGAAPQTTAHTLSDASSDVFKMVKHLKENKVTARLITDSTDDGYNKLAVQFLVERNTFEKSSSVLQMNIRDEHLQGLESHNEMLIMSYPTSCTCKHNLITISNFHIHFNIIKQTNSFYVSLQK